VNVRFEPARRLRGEFSPPADKSISHRAALLGAMKAEPVRVYNFLDAADTTATLDAIRALGALVELHSDCVVIRGTGLREAREAAGPIDVRNAGTLMRLLPGWLAFQEGRSWTIDGDSSIRRRPVDRIAEPLRAMGAQLEASEGRYPPFTITGARLHSITYDLPVASAQVKSCIMLAALAADGETTVGEPAPSRDHTERILARCGAPVSRAGRYVTIGNVDELSAHELHVPGDFSSAAFAIAAALLVPRSKVLVCGVNVNWTRTGFLRIVERMGGIVAGDLEAPTRDEIPRDEPVSDVEVLASSLQGTTVTADEVGLAIDELPLVALLGCFADGETVVTGAHELRVKESDRITAVVEGLRGLGADIEATDDGFVVIGTGELRGGTLDSRGDHRLAMLGAIAGLASREGVEVVGMEAAAVSYPRFMDDIAALV
jgi:3-phosphoshikimate 1-carboxyvinyltransferase